MPAAVTSQLLKKAPVSRLFGSLLSELADLSNLVKA